MKIRPNDKKSDKPNDRKEKGYSEFAIIHNNSLIQEYKMACD